MTSESFSTTYHVLFSMTFQALKIVLINSMTFIIWGTPWLSPSLWSSSHRCWIICRAWLTSCGSLLSSLIRCIKCNRLKSSRRSKSTRVECVFNLLKSNWKQQLNQSTNMLVLPHAMLGSSATTCLTSHSTQMYYKPFGKQFYGSDDQTNSYSTEG